FPSAGYGFLVKQSTGCSISGQISRHTKAGPQRCSCFPSAGYGFLVKQSTGCSISGQISRHTMRHNQ
ncbi:hypothetical protein, partial [Aeromonas hydrophila]|uniref:hypothetical protein n=1 Tax=Aeromonas hydrophila TaxID=644 RepID=UPI003D1FEE71